MADSKQAPGPARASGLKRPPIFKPLTVLSPEEQTERDMLHVNIENRKSLAAYSFVAPVPRKRSAIWCTASPEPKIAPASSVTGPTIVELVPTVDPDGEIILTTAGQTTLAQSFSSSHPKPHTQIGPVPKIAPTSSVTGPTMMELVPTVDANGEIILTTAGQTTLAISGSSILPALLAGEQDPPAEDPYNGNFDDDVQREYRASSCVYSNMAETYYVDEAPSIGPGGDGDDIVVVLVDDAVGVPASKPVLVPGTSESGCDHVDPSDRPVMEVTLGSLDSSLASVQEASGSGFCCTEQACAGQVFKYKKTLTEHQRLKHGEARYPCPDKNCSQVFNKRVNLKHHEQWHFGYNNLFKCSVPECTFTSRQERSLQAHMVTKHNSTDHSVVCETCSKRIPKSTIARHLNQHKSKVLFCISCPGPNYPSFARLESLKRHMNKQHSSLPL